MSVSAGARELAGKTAAEIRRRGWVQATMTDYTYTSSTADCRVCLVGGIAAAVTGNPEDGDEFADGWKVPPTAARELADEILMRVDDYDRDFAGALHRVISWNDRGDRKVEEVLAVLDSIAADQ